MGKPTVRSGSVPVLYFRRDVDYIAGVQFFGGLAPFLIVSASCCTKQDLSAAMVDMPVVPAARLKGDIGDRNAHVA